MMIENLKKRLEMLDSSVAQAMANANMLIGAREEIKHLIANFDAPAEVEIISAGGTEE